MAEFFLELFSEEIPARMQARGAEELARLLGEALAPLSPTEVRTFFGPRRIAFAAQVAAGVAARSSSERGPRTSAPEQALAGFLRKHGATRAQLKPEGDFWVLEREVPGVEAAALIAAALPGLLRRFSWPKSMRWGGTSAFTWVRPLRRIVCLLEGAVVPFDLREGSDDGHGLAASDITEGHRFLSPGEIRVTSCADWQARLRAAHVIVDAAERRALVDDGLRNQAAIRGLALVEDAGLLDEVAGLVEWPVPLIGAIGQEYMHLPPEVMQVSMRVNQRYFALRDAFGAAAPFFAFAANVIAPDGGATIIAGNERVLRARFSDAKHFWDLDRARSLESRVAALDAITFHAKLGSQGARVRRIRALAKTIAPLVGADPNFADKAAKLAKADLTTGLVGEFPELQGVIGGYYATHDGEEPCVAEAIRDHYLPKGPRDSLPDNTVGAAVALADKLDVIVALFAAGERPTGSGDPFALRRAALGIIRILRERGINLELRPLIRNAYSAAKADIIDVAVDLTETKKRELDAARGFEDGEPSGGAVQRFVTEDRFTADVVSFVLERLRAQLRAEGERHDVLNAMLESGRNDDIASLLYRVDVISAFLKSNVGTNLLAGFRRAANILRDEEKKNGIVEGYVDVMLLGEPDELVLYNQYVAVQARLGLLRQQDAVLASIAPSSVADSEFPYVLEALSTLRGPIDAFFNTIQVNAERPELRRNRLRLLAAIRGAMKMVADFERIEG